MRILFLDILTDQPKLRELAERDIMRTSYSELFRQGMEHPSEQWSSIDASKGIFPALSEFEALVISGSMENAVPEQEKPWMHQTYAFIRDAIEQKKPLLGVCGGLQFTIRALGGTIIQSPIGRNFGLSTTTLTDAGQNDPLLATYGKEARVFVSHSYRASDLPEGCQLLSSSAKCPFDAIGYQSHVRLLQFHPEFTSEIIAGLAELHRETLIRDGYTSEEGFSTYLEETRALRHTGHTLLGSVVPFFKNVSSQVY
jgi:GMP synthase (glutamine-hydrolysing)